MRVTEEQRQSLMVLLETPKIEADKTMLIQAPLLFSPGQLALAALRRSNQVHGVLDFERFSQTNLAVLFTLESVIAVFRIGVLSSAEIDSLMTIVTNPRQFNKPYWFLNRKKDYKDGKFSQVTSNALDMKLRDDLERLKIRNQHGLHHYWGLRVRGQHTKTTCRREKTVGVSKKR